MDHLRKTIYVAQNILLVHPSSIQPPDSATRLKIVAGHKKNNQLKKPH